MRRLITFALALCLALPSAAHAAAPVALRTDTTDADGVVTLGDLFEGAGAASGVRVAARSGGSVILDATAVQILARRNGLDWGNPDRLRRIIVRPGEEAPAASVRRGEVQALTYARSLAAGEEVRAEDLIWTRAVAAPADAIRDADDAIGKIARRPLREGALVSTRDVSAPVVIQAGDLVTVTYQNGGVSLALEVKALDAGAVGDVISLQNLSSRKTIQAVVMGPGQAATGPDAPKGAVSVATRIARR
ncbi:flagellar basal body P-ring formation chaperone FlgA [Phenylobacterium sp.]|uniref:flagellar basal body P-ring formation chaperone FlgA n=1 Tax=Phenylobacterium sp. TaxID=1871053 RepID=UPI0025D12424|nr:flagellar basal body P-ring formation chaperone FlgA [Phenylobacterium sp.]MCA6313407.1 flagellar basal body P-ring formation protein FlgA [Phenylobacterium sp.]